MHLRPSTHSRAGWTRPAISVSVAVAFLAGCAAYPTPTPVPLVPAPPEMAAVPELPAAPTATRPLPTEKPLPTTLPAVSSEPTPVAARTPTPVPLANRTPSHDLAALEEYQRGVAYIAEDRNAYRSPASDRALDELFATGANYVSLLVLWYQKDINSTEIQPAVNTPSDQDLAHVIEYAHAHGLRVLLKPQVDFSDDPEHWRGEIDFPNAAGWQAWFASYRRFIINYARFAQEQGVEEFSVGTELVSASWHTGEWRAIIRDVRAVYTGLLTYSANHSGEEVQVQFWDDLDFIGINNFYHLTNFRNPTLDQLIEGWRLPVMQLTKLHERFPRQPIIFTEIGYPSLDGANVWPWKWGREAAVDVQEQASCYEAMFRAWWKNSERPWFRGLFVWSWLADPNQGGLDNGDYTPHGKPAESVLRAWFADRPDLSPFAALEPYPAATLVPAQ